jgi:AbrB family looped-hinge helix DNA binding protein
VIATITSKGQVTIPLAIRERLGLKAGDQIDFDEKASLLIGRRAVNKNEWLSALDEWKSISEKVLQGHPWQESSSAEIVDDLRGGSTEVDPGK